MYYIIDRFEENFAVCENSETKERINIERYKIPEEAMQGDVLVFIDGIYIIDNDKTEEIKRIIHEKIKGLWN